MSLQLVILPLPMMVAWVMLTGQVNPAGFILGYGLSFALAVMVTREETIDLHPRKLPGQLFAFGAYVVHLYYEIFLSSVDVALRVMGFRPLKPGIIAVSTQDDNVVTAGASAHAITVTPGQLVVEFEGNHLMYVHCLDVESSAKTLDSDQTRRLKALKRIRGRD